MLDLSPRAAPVPAMRSASSSETRFFLPHIRQQTMAMPPSRMAPPTPPMTPPMIAFFSEVRPPESPPELLLLLLRAVSVLVPVVCSNVLVPTLVWRRVEPLVTTSMTVVVCTTSVETSGLVMTVWEAFAVGLGVVCTLRVLEAVDCVAPGGVVDGAGAGVDGVDSSPDGESDEDGADGGVDEGSESGVEEGSSTDVDSGGGLEERVGSDEAAPVPSAWRLTPWWRYALMPSMWRASSTLKAVDSATRASRAKRSHDDRIVLSMFLEDGGGKREKRARGGWVERERVCIRPSRTCFRVGGG